MNMSFFTLKGKTGNTLTSLRMWVMYLPNLLNSSLIGLEQSQVDILISPLVFTYPWADAESHDDVIYIVGTTSMYFYIYVYCQKVKWYGKWRTMGLLREVMRPMQKKVGRV